jgi:hypothetical protein
MASLKEVKEHQDEVLKQAREQNETLASLEKQFAASGMLMRDAIANGDVNLQRSLKVERDSLSDQIANLNEDIKQADTKQLIYEQQNQKIFESTLGTLMGIKKFQRDDEKRQSKFWGRYFGTPGDFRQKFQGIADIGKNLKDTIVSTFDKIPGVQAIKSGIGTFFDIIKAGIMLVGGIIALQAFVDGFDKATERLGKGDLIASFSSGLASIVQVFTGMDEESTIELAERLDYGFNKVKDILVGITTSLGRVLGIVPRIEGETDTLGTYLGDYAIALGAVAYIFPGLTKALFALGKFTTLTLIPAVYGFGASLLATLKGATIAIGFIQVPLLPFIGIGLLIAAAFGVLVYGLYKLYDAIKGVADENFGSISNMFSLAFAYVKDGFASAINGIVGFINGLIEMFNSVSPVDIPLIPFEMSGGNVAAVKAKIAADVERLEREKAAEPPAGVAPSPNSQIPNMPNIVSAPTSITNNTNVTSAPLRPEPGVSNSYRFTNAYVPN